MDKIIELMLVELRSDTLKATDELTRSMNATKGSLENRVYCVKGAMENLIKAEDMEKRFHLMLPSPENKKQEEKTEENGEG